MSFGPSEVLEQAPAEQPAPEPQPLQPPPEVFVTPEQVPSEPSKQMAEGEDKGFVGPGAP